MLVSVRLALAPLMLILALHQTRGLLMAACLVVALLSDIFDGIIARRLGVASEALRRADSIVDTAFYLATASAVWILAPQEIRSRSWSLGFLVALELSRYVVDLRKFGREASYHAYSAKLWGLVLAIALIRLLASGLGGWLLTLAIWLGIIADVEGLAISALLPTWTHDVRSVFHARRLARLAQSAG